jgi:hypothetical protein
MEKGEAAIDLPQEQELGIKTSNLDLEKAGSGIRPVANEENKRYSSAASSSDDEEAAHDHHRHDPELAVKRVVTAQDWTGPDDPENPHNWSLSKRMWHTMQPALFGFAV